MESKGGGRCCVLGTSSFKVVAMMMKKHLGGLESHLLGLVPQLLEQHTAREKEVEEGQGV